MPAYDSRANSLAHIHAVRDHVGVFITAMLRRAQAHDASKFSPEEKPIFDEVFPMLKGVSYGSPEWNAAIERAAPALSHHYKCNSHHPEHYTNGIAGMDLFDLVEMLCDWMAAAQRNPSDGVRLDLNVRAFGIEPQLASILSNTLARWPASSG